MPWPIADCRKAQRRDKRDCPESAVWRGYRTLLSLRRESLDRREPSRAVHRVLRICAGRSGVQLSSKLCVHAAAGERIAAFDRGLFPRRTGGACLGSFGWSHLGNRDHLQFCCGLHAHGGAGNFVFARRGQYHDFRGLGRFRVERVSRRQQRGEALARADVQPYLFWVWFQYRWRRCSDRQHMAADNHYDVIIIGTGAGGGTLAYHLAPSGKRILLLERGGYLPREKDNWDAQGRLCRIQVQGQRDLA